MSAYCAKADLVERFGLTELQRLTDEDAATTEQDPEITKTCDEASSLIDSYLSVRYTVPLAAETLPTIVRKWACDITRKFLWKDRADQDSVVTANYRDALAQLEDVARGIAGLPTAEGVPAATTGGFGYTRPVAVFDTTGLLPGIQ